MTSLRRTPIIQRLFVLALTLLFAACAAPPPKPERPAAPTSELAFDAGVDYAVDDLLIQARRLPAFAPAGGALGALIKKDDAGAARGVFTVDAAIDGVTGQQTIASRALDARLLRRAATSFAQFEVLPVSADVLAKAQYLLVGTLTLVEAGKANGGAYRISLSLTELKSGFVVAQSAVRIRGDAVDTTPTPFYRDSPSLTKDRAVEGQIRTAETATGSAADEFYLSRLPISALVSDSAKLYENGDYAGALRQYEQAAARPDGQQLRVFNGLYLVNTQLGRLDEAEKAFAKIVALGLTTNSLSVKFLFRPGSLDFWADPKISGPYESWLRAIARGIMASATCVTVVGHTSRTGTEAFNDALSLRRAQTIQRRIEAAVADAAARLKSVGMGFRENLVGSGADDLRDALDRRVSFTARDCKA